MIQKKIVIIGAGPAGLTAAYELARNQKYSVCILESDPIVGGISKTVRHQDNLIDIGGHRFFSHSKKVLDWWLQFLPIVDTTGHLEINYHQQSQSLDEIILKKSEDAMLIRSRKSRIYFKKNLIDYPLKINLGLLKSLGLRSSFRIIIGILQSRLFPLKEVKNLEDFFINNFGKELYQVFFKEYTEKVWGKPCTELSADWGRQRIKSLKIRQIVFHSITKWSMPQRKVKSQARTLIEKFLYPSKGPGMLWEKVSEECQKMGVTLITNAKVNALQFQGNLVKSVSFIGKDNLPHEIECDAVFSTMPVKDLINSMQTEIPTPVVSTAESLEYRDFIIVGLELQKLRLVPEKGKKMVEDNWLYIQDQGVKVGRLQLFNNWSPFMTTNDHAWIGAEYFCKEGDDVWSLTDEALIDLGLSELESIGILNKNDFVSGKVVRCLKAYPSYTGSYSQIHIIQEFLERKSNLFLMGRNGLHKYNNQDHSMLTAFKAVELFEKSLTSKKEIWAINSDDEYIG